MDEERYYTAEGCEELCSEINCLIDTIKYLFSCVHNNINPEDAKFLTPELIEAFNQVVDSTEDLQSAFKFYHLQFLKDRLENPT